MKNLSTRRLVRGAIIAALYAVFTLALSAISYGAVQVRVSEAMTLLPILFPEAVAGVTLGCLLANLLGGSMLPDIVFGTLATFLAAVMTRKLRAKLFPAAMMPVLFNGFIVGAVVHYCYAPEMALVLCMLSVAAGEAIACLILGPIFLKALSKLPDKFMN